VDHRYDAVTTDAAILAGFVHEPRYRGVGQRARPGLGDRAGGARRGAHLATAVPAGAADADPDDPRVGGPGPAWRPGVAGVRRGAPAVPGRGRVHLVRAGDRVRRAEW